VDGEHILDKIDVDVLPLEVGDGLHAGLLDVLLHLLQQDLLRPGDGLEQAVQVSQVTPTLTWYRYTKYDCPIFSTVI
jgi:hypothetical protein